tara:strand:- start:4415 stop:4651 length:237 start_codon:yes stop_codon:yes gene_type:complete
MLMYSLSVIGGFALAKWAVPRVPSLKTEKYHLHHWIWSSLILLGFMFITVTDITIGLFTGVALQGLTYKNWGIKRNDN